MNLGNIIYLDLNKVDLYGWEREKSDLVIDSIVRGIEAGDDFPAVPVMMINEGKYQLDDIILKYHHSFTGTFNPVDGGHRRALGHYIANQPLKCRITCIGAEQTEWVNLKDMVLIDDSEIVAKKMGYCYRQIKEIDTRYR